MEARFADSAQVEVESGWWGAVRRSGVWKRGEISKNFGVCTSSGRKKHIRD